MKLDYFKTLFQRLVWTPRLYPADQHRWHTTDPAPEPDAADAHTNLSNNPVFIRFLQEHRGSFIALSSIDDEERLVQLLRGR
ncbi:MAG: hypothetical protein ACFWUJ_14535 [Pseudomonas fragi]